ncbi:hypothetical protein TcWFU_003526 [Taenia crassiceps]|uniref:Uncharacterized protein n=1 Tax=Taenia crassiceps TaxID=6207 RepID=A0ABR4QD97_9CEST
MHQVCTTTSPPPSHMTPHNPFTPPATTTPTPVNPNSPIPTRTCRTLQPHYANETFFNPPQTSLHTTVTTSVVMASTLHHSPNTYANKQPVCMCDVLLHTPHQISSSPIRYLHNIPTSSRQHAKQPSLCIHNLQQSNRTA